MVSFEGLLQIRILPSDMKRLRRDNPQRALFENVERAAGLAQVKIKADISSPPQDVGSFPAAEKCRLRAIVESRYLPNSIAVFIQ